MWKTDDRALRVQVGAKSVAGPGRTVNQDVTIVGPGIFGLADGMGGPGGGDVAAAIAVAEVVDAITARKDGVEAATAAHDAVLARQSTATESHLRGMGTTVCFGVVGWQEDEAAVQITNVGDSRAYLLHARTWSQVTRDQSHVQELVDEGALTPEQAWQHPQRNIVTSAVGYARGFRAEASSIVAAAGMRLMFCSDGVSDVLADDALQKLVRGRVHPQAIADRVLDAVARAHGYDDATAVVVDILAVSRT
jgi:protein phosphatase